MNIKELIKKGESEKVEFKKFLQLKDQIGEAVSAFSNTRDGTIIVGFDEKNNELIGVEIGKNTMEELANYIKQHTDSPVFPHIKVENSDNKEIIVIEVSESDEKPVLFKGRAYKRVGKSSHKASSAEIRKLALESKKIYWDERVCEDAALKDIDEKKFRWFLREARIKRGLKISEYSDIKDALIKLKLLKNEKLTNAAALLFSKESLFLQSEVKCIRFSGNDPVKPYIDFQTLEGDVLDLIDRAEDFVLRNIRKAIWLVPGQVQREEKYEYPPDAIREAIANAVVHRDYETTSKVQVRVFDEYIEIWNPGKLPTGWTVETLKQKHESAPKNPLLFKQLFWVNYVEDVGGGITDMVHDCEEWGIPEPEFEDTGTSIVVTFRKSIFTEEFLEKMELTERQKKAVEYIKENNKITNKEYQNINFVSRQTASRELANLTQKGILQQMGITGSGTFYVLTQTPHKRPINAPNDSKVMQERESINKSTTFRKPELTEDFLDNLELNERQKKAVDFLKESGKITNQDFQKLCPDVTRETLRKDLNDLVNKTIITKKGIKRGVYYELV